MSLMEIHPILREKLAAALRPVAVPQATRRDATLPAVPGKAHAVIGLRRAGKTTFLRQLQVDRCRDLPPERAVFLGLDDDRLAGLDAGQLDAVLEEYFRLFPQHRGAETVWWFLDEVQLLPGWDRFVRRVMDEEKVEVVVSGSSAKMLSREVHTSLRGRGTETVIRPFSFREFLRHRGEEPEGPSAPLVARERSLVEKRFREYLTIGGMPELQGLEVDVRLDLLQGYVDTVLFRDVVERHGISQVAATRWLARQCLRNPAGSFSVHRLHQDLRAQGLGVAKDLLHALVGHLEDSFLIRAVPLATDSERQRNSNPRKVYPADTGFIAAFDRSGRPNTGHALETVVLHELDRRKAEVGWVRTAGGFEVDFLARFRGGFEELIQVCAELDGAEKRELRALEDAAREHPRARRRLLVPTLQQALQVRAEGMTVQPAYEWLLGPVDHG